MIVTIAKWFASLTFRYVCKLNTVTSFQPSKNISFSPYGASFPINAPSRASCFSSAEQMKERKYERNRILLESFESLKAWQVQAFLLGNCITSLPNVVGYFWWCGGGALRFHLNAGGHPSRAPGQGEGARDARLALRSDKALPSLKVTLTPWKLSAGPVGCQLLWTCHGLLSTLMMTTARGRPAQHCMRTGETPPSFLSSFHSPQHGFIALILVLFIIYCSHQNKILWSIVFWM